MNGLAHAQHTVAHAQIQNHGKFPDPIWDFPYLRPSGPLLSLESHFRSPKGGMTIFFKSLKPLKSADLKGGIKILKIGLSLLDQSMQDCDKC